MRIPLPKMMRHLREQEFEGKTGPAVMRKGIKMWAFYAKRPWLYHALAKLKFRVLGTLGRRKGRFRRVPGGAGWTAHRDFPAPQPGGTFQAQWSARRGRRSPNA